MASPGTENHHLAGVEILAGDRNLAFENVDAAILVIIRQRQPRARIQYRVGIEHVR